MISTYILPGIKGVVSDLTDCNFFERQGNGNNKLTKRTKPCHVTTH